MRIRGRDWKWASLGALGLLTAAAFIAFVIHPGEFEGQIGWFIALLPGAWVVGSVAGRLPEFPGATLVFGAAAMAITFLWYFAVSYVAIKLWRLLVALGR